MLAVAVHHLIIQNEYVSLYENALFSLHDISAAPVGGSFL
jgi:hypothetical protein